MFFSVWMGATSKGMKDCISLINDAGRICNCEEINEAVNMQIRASHHLLAMIIAR